MVKPFRQEGLTHTAMTTTDGVVTEPDSGLVLVGLSHERDYMPAPGFRGIRVARRVPHGMQG